MYESDIYEFFLWKLISCLYFLKSLKSESLCLYGQMSSHNEFQLHIGPVAQSSVKSAWFKSDLEVYQT